MKEASQAFIAFLHLCDCLLFLHKEPGLRNEDGAENHMALCWFCRHCCVCQTSGVVLTKHLQGRSGTKLAELLKTHKNKECVGPNFRNGIHFHFIFVQRVTPQASQCRVTVDPQISNKHNQLLHKICLVRSDLWKVNGLFSKHCIVMLDKSISIQSAHKNIHHLLPVPI